MFKIFLLTLDPETKALLTRFLDVLESNQQAKIDELTAALAGLRIRLHASSEKLKNALGTLAD